VPEIAGTQRALARASGQPVVLFRPPYGANDAAVDAEARTRRMLTVLWSIDSRDSQGASWKQIAARVERQAHPGAIVLMHENRGQTIRALHRLLLPWLRRHGYRLVSVPELLAFDPPTPAQLRAGWRGCQES
jgi:peptidoglycan/xylan/chitin deacetylase (PgdA/CDA1 family)